jgi:hypothetical protein
MDAGRRTQPWLEGAHALRQRLSAENQIDAALVYRKQLDLETLVAAYHTSVAILPQKRKLWPSNGRSS